ncbi:SDR family NAD(P)-dependent oxidoreductase [Pseudoxanthomonas sp.]|uniref:SDR family NAD(P)-dependent oxidoreductase n=1 Tax=Pseudoxanthomonas sp. TaxID=1871049 RepID=UPI0026209F46|nr:SDR family NAD(P)-dependent oxidoreductase [Pseudoxanthomonas sp.]WDS37030.1 MAG: SDR family NAD(P)-dependent oxidoreductase [Pseudoxanthomonas sp.]
MSTVLITGGHSGLGFEASKQLASMGSDLVIAGRDLGRIGDAASELRSVFGVKVHALQMDVSSLDSVRRAAAICEGKIRNGEMGRLQAVICNAGGSFPGEVAFSADGYEITFATNYLGHFLLVQLLLESLTDEGRIVFVASGTHDPDTSDGKLVGKALTADVSALARLGRGGATSSTFGQRYATSKLCMILCAYELDRRLRRAGRSTSSIAYDPGSIPETGLMRGLPAPLQWLSKTSAMRLASKMMGITQGRLDFSGASMARIAIDPAYAHVSGKYLQSSNGKLSVTKSSVASYNEASAAKLWDDSQRLADSQGSEGKTPV